MLNSIRDAVAQLLPHKRKTNSSSGWISFNAPCCVHNGESADTRGRGGIVMNADGGVSYHCFNCNFKASYVPGRHLTYKFRKLLLWLGADEGTVKRLVIEAVRIQSLVSPEKIIESEETEAIDFKPRPLPADAKSLAQWSTWYKLQDYKNVPDFLKSAIAYSSQRKINFSQYDLYWTPETQYNLNKRVIVPFTWHNQIIGYTARAFDNNVRPKYHSSYEPNYVFNVDGQLKESKFVIVVEGPFDAMSIDGVAILSNECSEIQADIIDSLGKEVIVVPDADRAGIKLIDQAIEYGWSVSFPVWQKTQKDVSSAVEKYGKLFVIKTILDARQSNKLKIEIYKRKIHT